MDIIVNFSAGGKNGKKVKKALIAVEKRLKERMGNLPENDMDRIDKALSVSFGLLDNI